MTGHCYLLFVLSQLLGHPEGHIDINDFASLPAFPLQVHFCPAKQNKPLVPSVYALSLFKTSTADSRDNQHTMSKSTVNERVCP